MIQRKRTDRLVYNLCGEVGKQCGKSSSMWHKSCYGDDDDLKPTGMN